MNLNGLSEALTRINSRASELLDRLTKAVEINEESEKIMAMKSETYMSRILQEVFAGEADKDIRQFMSNAWANGLKNTPKFIEKDLSYTAPLGILHGQEKYWSDTKERFEQGHDRSIDAELREISKGWYKEMNGKSSGYASFCGGTNQVTPGNLSGVTWRFNDEHDSLDFEARPYANLSLDMWANGRDSITRQLSPFNLAPNGYKALVLVQAMRFWCHGLFDQGSQRGSMMKMTNNEYRKFTSTETAKRRISKMRDSFIRSDMEKLPRNLVSAIKSLNPTGLLDATGFLLFQLSSSDYTYMIYQVEDKDDFQQDRPKYSFAVVEPTFVHGDWKEEDYFQLFIGRLKAFKLIADFLMGGVVEGTMPEILEMEENQKIFEAMFEEYLRPKYDTISGGKENE